MTNDDLLRVGLVVVIVIFAPIAMLYRVRSDSGEKLDRRQEGTFILVGLRLSGLPVLVGGLAWLIRPEWMAWASVPIPLALRWMGLALFALGAILVIWTFHHLGKNLTDTVVTRESHSLVTSGPYRFVRHPFYLAYAMGMMGGSLATRNVFLFLAGCIPLAFLVARTRIEEDKLIARFGDDYRNYMATTGRFLPRMPR